MKDWAIEKGATHFTHWFQPMNGITAEKHESFISPTDEGKIIMEFSGKELIKGEPDASSFPSGGLRATFEARGYTVWDCTSPAFLKEDASGVTLCIPTAFCSYTGEALDKKTPLLRSMVTISNQSIRVLRLLGNTTANSVVATVGAEQEYFLIDKNLYNKRKDLVYTGRTLFGAKPPKGQELDDHYFGILKDRVASFMKDIDRELWKLGVTAKTKHNEVAPSQHELASIFTNANISTDHNQITMEVMKRVASTHDLACLLHEKPFAGVNGSGKHNNWSLSTDDGQNLLDPRKTPHENSQFLLFLCAVIEAIDKYPELLRVSAANPGNDHRLGGNEAPPAIISIFLGDELTSILENIASGDESSSKERETLVTGVATFPEFRKDTTDRNRTSPFAFTGNKFEFRMVPSSASISDANVVLNTIVAESLCNIADRLEKTTDIGQEINKILKEIVIKHGRIIFNGDGYASEWEVEAEKRGLLNIKSTIEAIPALIMDKSIELFEKHNVFTKAELHSRYEVMLETYNKKINIEAQTMLEMAKKEILPCAIKFSNDLAVSYNNLKATGMELDLSAQYEILKEFTSNVGDFRKNIVELEGVLEKAQIIGDSMEQGKFYKEKVVPQMNILRGFGDKIESNIDFKLWPMPTYGELMFSL
jgi:glutamine synthetase